MNAPYPIPSSTYNNVGYFYANNQNYLLGAYTKNVDDATLVTVDYTQLLPATTITTFQFVIDVGGSPPLIVSQPILLNNILKFTLSGGVSGVSYNLKVTCANTYGIRTDTLTINIPSDPCGCGTGSVIPVGGGFGVSTPGQPTYMLGSGNFYFSSMVRFFVQGDQPLGPNVMDWWYDTATNLLYMYVSNSNQQWWMQIGGLSVVISNLFEEAVTIIGQSTFANLTYSPVGMIQLIINKQVFTSAGANPDFIVSGNQIVWKTLDYTPMPTDTAVAIYTH